MDATIICIMLLLLIAQWLSYYTINKRIAQDTKYYDEQIKKCVYYVEDETDKLTRQVYKDILTTSDVTKISKQLNDLDDKVKLTVATSRIVLDILTRLDRLEKITKYSKGVKRGLSIYK